MYVTDGCVKRDISLAIVNQEKALCDANESVNFDEAKKAERYWPPKADSEQGGGKEARTTCMHV